MAVRRPHLAGGCWARVRKSELGRQIAVDLKSDANLYENRGRPSHGASFQPHSDRRLPQEPVRYIGLIWHSCKGSSASRWQPAKVQGQTGRSSGAALGSGSYNPAKLRKPPTTKESVRSLMRQLAPQPLRKHAKEAVLPIVHRPRR
jgi:hypothetical protein